MRFDSDARAVLFDRDATLVVDVPYNADPTLVRPMPGAVEAVGRVRAAGLLIGVVSNQSGIARGLLTTAQVEAVNGRVDEIFGSFDVWRYCPHGSADYCACRKPRPGLVLSACEALAVVPGDTVVIGDIGADVSAAAAAGARGILVPTPITRAEEIAAAEYVVSDLGAAVDLVMSGLSTASMIERAVAR